METIETVAAKLGIELTEHQKKMLPAIEWLTSMETPPPEKRGRTTLFALLSIARAMNKPNSRLGMIFHEALWGAEVPAGHVRRVTTGALMGLVQGRTRLLGGDIFVDETGRIRFVPKPAA